MRSPESRNDEAAVSPTNETKEVIPMVRASEYVMRRGATWKWIGLVFGALTLIAGAAFADEGDLVRGRRLQLPTRPHRAAVKEVPNPGSDVIIIPDPRPKQRPQRGGPRQEHPAAVESSPRQNWFAWFVQRARF